MTNTSDAVARAARQHPGGLRKIATEHELCAHLLWAFPQIHDGFQLLCVISLLRVRDCPLIVQLRRANAVTPTVFNFCKQVGMPFQQQDPQ